jgi:feruloyl esterase
MRLQSFLVRAGCTLIVAGANYAIAQQTCEGLKNLKLDHATVVSAVSVEPAPLKQPSGVPFKVPNVTVPRHCEVFGVARPTSDSEIDFTIWLPPQDVWNGKYLQRGNGGWAGSIQPVVLVAPLAHGYAVSATDDGHRTEGMMPDASWAIGHPEKLIDFGFRSLHETASLSKMIVHAYYGKDVARAYFSGCSDGGREALMEAERFPEDFDGIIAGAPANNWTHHFTGFVWNEMALSEKPESKITAEKLPAIQRAALAACDGLDGVKDGLIEDPRKCHFDPSVLLCHGADGAGCLTQPQIEALSKIYAGPQNPRTGEQIYPGYEPGTEAEPGAWTMWILGPVQSAFGNSFFSGAVFEDSHWDWRTIDFDRDVRLADEKTGYILNSYNPDLRSFHAHGGKLIQYHGWGDAAIAPRDSIAFYEKVQAFLKRYPDPRSTNAGDIQSFYRLFMVPGMGHCTGGPGATSFGNDDIADRDGIPDDSDHDILLALDRWVTQGVAPDKIIANGRVGADQESGSEGVRLTRPLCAYPAVARYKGQGDTNAEENFECVPEPAR